MPRALFLGLPLHGHTNPTLPLMSELVARGHEVIYYATEPFKQAVEATGATFRPYRNHHLNHTAGIPQNLDKLVYLLSRTAREVLDEQLDEFRSVGADYVIRDAQAPWGHWVSSVLAVPVVTSVTTMAVNKAVMRYGFAHGARPESSGMVLSKLHHIWKGWRVHRQLRRRYPRNPPPFLAALTGVSGLNIVYTSRAFQPCVETFDARYVFVGPSMSRREPDTVMVPDDPRPLVYVSFGTLFNQAVEFYRTCFQALGSEPVRVILSTGSGVAVEALGVPPQNFSVYERVPQLQMLSRAVAFVSHGGMNSVSESLSFGVPLVVIPQMSEQLIVGRRAEELGAAVVLDKRNLAADSLRSAVNRVLAESGFRQRAAVIGHSFRSAGGPAKAVDAIEQFLRTTQSAAPGRPSR